MFLLWFLLLLIAVIPHEKANKIPIIIDTDVGYAMDDAFAISFALKKTVDIFDIKLISTSTLNTTRRATILCNFLSTIGYNDIDIGIGIPTKCKNDPSYIFDYGCVGPMWYWNNGYKLSQYKGKVYNNGINRIIEIMKHHSPSNPIYIIALAPLTNFGYIFDKYPHLRQNTRFFIMSGELFQSSSPLGYFPEWNVVADIKSAQIVYNKRNKYKYDGYLTDITWDTGYMFQITGYQYQRLLNSDNILAKTLIAAYRIQYKYGGYSLDTGRVFTPNISTPSMYDLETILVAYYVLKQVLLNDNMNLDDNEYNELLANINIPYLELKPFNIKLNDSGYVIESPHILPPVYIVDKWKVNGIERASKQVVNVYLQQNKIQQPEPDNIDSITTSNSQFNWLEFISFLMLCIGVIILLYFGSKHVYSQWAMKGYDILS